MRLDTKGRIKKTTGARENNGRRTADRHGACGLRKLREARTKKPTNFVPKDVDRAREGDVESKDGESRNEDGTFPQRRRQESEGRKEGKTKSVARKEGAHEGDESIRVSPRSI